MTEWLNVHAWKACVGQLTGGSNPSLSAFFSEVPLTPSLFNILSHFKSVKPINCSSKEIDSVEIKVWQRPLKKGKSSL
jgi:hypothetical protein